MLGAGISELFEDTIMGMREVTEAIGLKGNLSWSSKMDFLLKKL